MYKILFINWNSEKVDSLIDFFQNLSYQLSFTFNREQTLNVLSHEKIDLIVTQQLSDTIDNLCTSADKSKSVCPDIPVITINEGIVSDKMAFLNLFLESVKEIQTASDI